jgi:hypothetical protein
MGKLGIHPAIGIARVGNAEAPAVPPVPFTKFFIGPENPGVPANWDDQARAFKSFKVDGKVLRQAARFHIFQFDDAGNPINEVTLLNGFKIEWRIHVANRKASFYTFNGQSGARTDTDPPYVSRARRPADDTERRNKGRGDPERKNRRNAAIGFDPGGNKPNAQVRRGLEIDPGEVAISAPGFKDLIDPATQTPIQFLGQIQMQSDGRLLFLGGSGDAKSTPNAAAIEQYANNDGWFDDVCDGIIHATVTFPDGHTEDVQPAWVLVGPPKFAPGIGHVVPLYDTLWDLAVRSKLPSQPGNDPVLQDLVAQQLAWQETTSDFAPSYQPSFTTHIYPILARALATRDVHEPPPGRPGYHGTLPDWADLSKRDEIQKRHSVFSRIRNPNAAELNRKDMPRGLGDDYTTLELFEEDTVNNPPPTPHSFLSLTRVQYALLKAWHEGRFNEDWTLGVIRYAPIPAPAPITPHGLDRSALENCVGGPFYPGIEISWLIRERGLYAEAFRLNDVGGNIGTPEFPLMVQAGFFSQQMALPWQADFYDCHKEEHTPPGERERFIYMWWTAQRPDDIRSVAGGDYRRWVEPFDAFKDPEVNDPDDPQNLARFEQMRTRWSDLSFVVLEGDQHVEQK